MSSDVRPLFQPVEGAEDISSSEEGENHESEEEFSVIDEEVSSEDSTLFDFVSSPPSRPQEDVVEIEASMSLLEPGQASPVRHQNPVEVGVIINQKGACSPRRSVKGAKAPKSKVSRTSRGKGAVKRRSREEDISVAPDQGDISQGPMPSPEWPAPNQPHSDTPASSSLEDKVETILVAITRMEERISSLEDNQFVGFPPSENNVPRSILKKSAPIPVVELSDSQPDRQSQQSLGFKDPLVSRSSESLIPEGWKKFRDGMSLGEEPGSIVFKDGTLFGPQSVEIDIDSYEVPIWRLRHKQGSVKPLKGKIPVRTAYENLQLILEGSPIAVEEWHETSFKPPGSNSDRALKVQLDDDAVVGEFFQNLRDWFRDFQRKEKITWEEAVSPSNFVPEGLSGVSAIQFARTFGRKEFEKNEPAKLLNAERMPTLPKGLLKDELGARQNFLSSLNVTLAAESLARQCPKENPLAQSLYAMLKLTLQPLWSSLKLFAKKKLQLRKCALKIFWPDNALVLKLLASNPLSEDLFPRETVREVVEQAERQAKSVFAVMGIRSSGTKRPAPQGQGRTPKRPRLQQNPRQDYQGQARRYQQQQGEERYADERRRGRLPSPNRKGLRTPKRAYKSPRGRGQRTPNTPRRQQNQGKEGNF